MKSNKDSRKGYWISSDEIKNRLEAVKKLDVEAKEPEWNLFVINHPNGQMRIKSRLTLEQWYEKYNKNASKKNVKTFNELNTDNLNSELC